MISKHIGFTGTHKGMTDKQKRELKDVLLLWHDAYSDNCTIVFHHGDCIGADAEAHDIAWMLGYVIEIHPPIRSKFRAFKNGDYCFKPKPYLERNRDIVDYADDELIACPSSEKEVLRSGTWSTVRYARKQDKKVTIIMP